AIAAARCPKLETLRVWFGSSSYGASGGVAGLQPLFDSFPALVELGLMNAEFTDDVIAPLPAAPLPRRPRVLDLSKGTLSTADALINCSGAFAHLDRLDVSDNCLPAGDPGRLRGLCKSVVTGTQKTERYVSLGE